jgi:hypothetical protein
VRNLALSGHCISVTPSQVAEPGVEPGMPEGDGFTDRGASRRSLPPGRVTGVEPATTWLTTRPIADLLTLSRSGRTRTCGLPDVGRPLSPLSY